MESRKTYTGTVVSYGKVVPLISSYTAGPLGLIHLPRLWLKALLLAGAMLAEDWGCGPGGLDKRIMTYVGIDGDEFVPWLISTLPPYSACEAWVRAHATNLTAAAIAESNAFLREHPLPQGLGPLFRAHMQITDETLDAGIMLNNYDDWHTLHWYLMTYRERLAPVVPAIGPDVTGALGIPHLPRFWAKTVLGALGALPPGYEPAREALDDLVLDRCGVDPAAARAYLERELPTYVAFEAWVSTRSAAIGSLTGQDWSDLPDLAPDALAAANDYDWLQLHASIAGRLPAASPAPAGIFAFEVTPMLER